jgi:hypothetical protein
MKPHSFRGRAAYPYAAALLALAAFTASAADLTVAKKNGQFRTIQAALDAAQPGDVVLVSEGTYFERPSFPRSGEESAWITLRAAPGAKAVLDGRGGVARHILDIDNQAYIRVIGLELTQNVGVRECACIHVGGLSHDIQIVSNVVHETRGTRVSGILVESPEGGAPTTGILVQGNLLYDLHSEDIGAIAVMGNVQDFTVERNTIRDVNGPGIRVGRHKMRPDNAKSCENADIRGNFVSRAKAAQGDGYVPGILVDGGRDLRIERNRVTDCDRGLEIAAEWAGIDTIGVVVKENLLFGNRKSGLIVGGYKQSAGRVRDSIFSGNICYRNDTMQQGYGELWLQWSSANRFEENVFYCGRGDLLLMCPDSQAGELNVLDRNTWYSENKDPGSVLFYWDGREYQGFKAYQAGSQQDAKSRFADPGFVNPAATNFQRKAR